jgi:hypothetical protein
MRNHALGMIALFAFAIVFSASSVRAQTPSPDAMTVEIPFEFTVGERSLPAGKYVIGRLSPTSSAVIVRSDDGGPSAVGMTSGSLHQTREDRKAKLVFKQYDGVYFLSQVWIPGRGVAVAITKSEQESALAKNGAEAKTVALVARR